MHEGSGAHFSCWEAVLKNKGMTLGYTEKLILKSPIFTNDKFGESRYYALNHLQQCPQLQQMTEP